MTKIIETDEFKKVKELVNSDEQVILLTGKAGTGKSTIIQYLRQSMKLKYVLLAPTGIAAINIGGQTIHSFFRFPPKFLTEEDISFYKNDDLISNLDLLILDEISMVRADVLDGIDIALRKTKESDLPFGGIKVLMIGDFFQLPPVVKDLAKFTSVYNSQFFFDSYVLRKVKLNCIELTEVFRQKNKEFISILDKIRVNTVGYADLEILNKKGSSNKKANKKAITLTTTNKKAKETNDQELQNLKGTQYEYEGELSKNFGVKGANLPAPLELNLKVGTKVMFTKNDESGEFVNGTLGIVTSLEQERIHVDISSDGESPYIVNVKEYTWKNFEYKWDKKAKKVGAVLKGTYTQFPLILAWAVTIHKSQGLTLDYVNVDMHTGAFASGQAYVALSRCKTLKGMRLIEPIRKSDIIVDEQIQDFYQSNFTDNEGIDISKRIHNKFKPIMYPSEKGISGEEGGALVEMINSISSEEYGDILADLSGRVPEFDRAMEFFEKNSSSLKDGFLSSSDVFIVLSAVLSFRIEDLNTESVKNKKKFLTNIK